MAFEFLKELYRNSVMGMEAAREKEEAHQRAVTRQEEEERRIKQFRQYHLDKIHEECLDKFGEGFAGKIYLDSCRELYPPDGLEKPIVKTRYENSKRFPAVNINPSKEKYEAAAEILKAMPEGVQFHSLALEENGSPTREYKLNVGVINYTHVETYTQKMRYTMQYAVSEEYSARFFSRFCTEYVIHDYLMPEEFIHQATIFSDRIWETRKDVIEKLLNLINEKSKYSKFGEIGEVEILSPPKSWDITMTGLKREKQEHLYSTYGLATLVPIQQYGLALCLARAVREHSYYQKEYRVNPYSRNEEIKKMVNISTINLRYRLRVSQEGVYFRLVNLPEKKAPEPPVVEPILEAW